MSIAATVLPSSFAWWGGRFLKRERERERKREKWKKV